jgi:hypothetical protein
VILLRFLNVDAAAWGFRGIKIEVGGTRNAEGLKSRLGILVDGPLRRVRASRFGVTS